MDEPSAAETAPDSRADTAVGTGADDRADTGADDGAGHGTDATDGPASMEDALGEDGQLIDEIEQSLRTESSEGEPVAALELEELVGPEGGGPTVRDLELLADVAVEVAVEFGTTRLRLRELLTLRRGSLVELARRPEEKVVVLANGTPIAYGDIVVVDDQVGVHIVELIDPRPDTADELATQAGAPEPATTASDPPAAVEHD